MSGARRKGDKQTGLHRLPPGRHGLPREFVIRNQRDRLAAGIISAVAERGFHDATITDISAAAGVSRRTFYTYFSSKEACYFDTYELILRHLGEATREAAEAQEGWTDKVRARIEAMLEFFAINPDLVRFVLITPARAGDEIARRYRAASERAFEALVDGVPSTARVASDTVRASIIGGMITLIVRQVEEGDGKDLPALGDDLVELVLAPYLGPERAARAARGEA